MGIPQFQFQFQSDGDSCQWVIGVDSSDIDSSDVIRQQVINDDDDEEEEEEKEEEEEEEEWYYVVCVTSQVLMYIFCSKSPPAWLGLSFIVYGATSLTPSRWNP